MSNLFSSFRPKLTSVKPKDEQGTRLLAPHYSLLSQDLRSLASIESALDAIIPDTEAPTLILAECVLAYLDPRNSRALLDLLRRKLKRPAAICYEMCIAGPSSTLDGVPAPSRFGNVMLSNLEVSSFYSHVAAPLRAQNLTVIRQGEKPRHARRAILFYTHLARQTLPRRLWTTDG